MNGSSDDPEVIARNLNKTIKNRCPVDERQVIIRRQYGMSQVCINTIGCQMGLSGYCTFCNYNHGNGLGNVDVDELIKIIVGSIHPGDTSLLIGSSGSILDDQEFPTSLLTKILEALEFVDIENLILETRLGTITVESLELIKNHTTHKINIEFGLESSNPGVLRYSLNKSLNLNEVASKVELVHKYGYHVTANVLLGAPLLTREEQITDTVSTIKWAIKNGVDDIVVFPINIRRYTLLESMYAEGLYEVIDQQMMLKVLSELCPEILARVSLSWTDPKQTDDRMIVVHPYSEFGHVYDIYKRFMDESDGKVRAVIVKEIPTDIRCN